MSNKPPKDGYYRLALILSVLAVGLMAYFIIIGIWFQDAEGFNGVVIEQMRMGLGDFLAGTIGVALSFISILLLISTFREQGKQFGISERREEKNIFESRYFNMLGMLNDVRDSVNANLKQACYKNLHDYVADLRLAYEDDLKRLGEGSVFEKIKKDDASSTAINNARDELGNIYDEFVERKPVSISFFFRFVYHAIKMVVDAKDLDNDRKKVYVSMLTALLSDEEMMLLYYSALSKKARNSEGKQKFFSDLDEIQFFENIDAAFLLDRSHHKIYDKTCFKFLNADELEQKRKN